MPHVGPDLLRIQPGGDEIVGIGGITAGVNGVDLAVSVVVPSVVTERVALVGIARPRTTEVIAVYGAVAVVVKAV